MKRQKFLLIFLSLSFWLLPTSGVESFNEGVRLYDQKKFEEALEVFSGMEAKGEISAELFYNMGNCHFRRGRLGMAIFYFEKAAVLNPSDEDIQQNLMFSRSLVRDKQDVVPLIAPLEWWLKTASFFNFRQWLFIIAFLFYPLTLFIIFRYLLKRDGIVYLLGFLVILFLMLIAGNLAYTRHSWLDSVQYGVIVQNSVEVLSSPHADGNKIFKTSEGVKVRIEDSVETWIKLKLPDGRTGWVKKGQIALI